METGLWMGFTPPPVTNTWSTPQIFWDIETAHSMSSLMVTYLVSFWSWDTVSTSKIECKSIFIDEKAWRPPLGGGKKVWNIWNRSFNCRGTYQRGRVCWQMVRRHSAIIQFHICWRKHMWLIHFQETLSGQYEQIRAWTISQEQNVQRKMKVYYTETSYTYWKAIS